MTRLAILLGNAVSFTVLAADQATTRSAGSWGKWVFAAALGLLLIWLVFMPARLIRQVPGIPWWRNVRVWAIVVCAIQLAIYVFFA